MTSTDPNITRGVIRAKWYSDTEQRLANDPIILAMAAGLAREPRDELAHPDGTPRHEFMGAANREYVERVAKAGADDQGRHLGAVATALLAVLDEDAVMHSFDTAAGEWVSVGKFRRYEVQVGSSMVTGLNKDQQCTWRITAVEEQASPEGHRMVTVEPVK